MIDNLELGPGKTAGDLTREALWFSVHTLLAVTVLALLVFAFYLGHAEIDQDSPKIYCTILALLAPMLVGFIVAKSRQDRTAKYVWISGLLIFSIVCVWVIDLPTGNGLCEDCAHNILQKLYRTFFDIHHGSGLMGGDGLLLGTWVPLSMIGYAIGAKFGLDE